MASNFSLLVAAIDFGTTYSGWASSFKHEYDADPTRISARQWSEQLVSLKAPTTVLIKPDGKTLDSFGYDAETKYAELASDDTAEYKMWYYFRRFKMILHGKMTFDRNIKLQDETDKFLPAKTVFTLAIRYLKEDLLKTVNERLPSNIKEEEITWVLTVPAIWNDPAKQFMREVAVEAGIKNENLRIALEPEAASIFCRLLPVGKMVEGGGISALQPGTKYMVLDAGGGTIDITVHEIMPSGKLKEIHKASGGAWGGTQVDEAFKQFIISLVGNPVFDRFKNESKEDYLDMFRDFEIKKRHVAPDNDKKVTFHFPSSLNEIFAKETNENLSNSIRQTRFAETVCLAGDKLRVESSVMRSFFSSAIHSTLSHIKELMKDGKILGISSILMIGGFSESKMLQSAIKSNFPNVRVIVPQEAGLVVLKGAVVFGHSPTSIAQRVSKYTYGIKPSQALDEKTPSGSHFRNIMKTHVQVDQIVALNESTTEISFVPQLEDQKNVQFALYVSTHRSPMHVTDEGCEKLGNVEIDIPDMGVPREERSIIVSMTYGGTEIEIKARDKRTGKATKVAVNFLG